MTERERQGRERGRGGGRERGVKAAVGKEMRRRRPGEKAVVADGGLAERR